VGDLLMLSLANLASYCEARGIGPRCDFTAFSDTEARASVEIAASPAEVFASLIEPAQLNRWIAEHAEAGGRGGLASGRAGPGRRVGREKSLAWPARPAHY
jgi:hypothetical protein